MHEGVGLRHRVLTCTTLVIFTTARNMRDHERRTSSNAAMWMCFLERVDVSYRDWCIMNSCTELATLLRFLVLQPDLGLEGWVDLSADARRRLVPDDPLGRLRSLDTDESDEYAVWLKLSGVADLAQPSLPTTGMSDPYAAVWCELTATLQSFPEAEFTADTAVKREPAETEFTVVKGEPAQQKVKQEPAPAKRAIQMQPSEVAPHKRVKQELELSAHSPPSTPRQKRRCSRSRRRRSNGLSPGQADETIPRHRSYRVRTCRP